MSVSAAQLAPELASRLQEAWQGEVFGKAMYGALTQRQTDPYRRWQWQALTQLETETGEAMRQLLSRHDCPTEEWDESARAGLAEAQRIGSMPWPEMIAAFANDLPEIITSYQQLERDCAFRGADADAMRLLVDHEVVSLAFAAAELRGESKSSIAPVLALLKEPPRFPA
jgi:hypothetical protein